MKPKSYHRSTQHPVHPKVMRHMQHLADPISRCKSLVGDSHIVALVCWNVPCWLLDQSCNRLANGSQSTSGCQSTRSTQAVMVSLLETLSRTSAMHNMRGYMTPQHSWWLRCSISMPYRSPDLKSLVARLPCMQGCSLGSQTCHGHSFARFWYWVCLHHLLPGVRQVTMFDVADDIPMQYTSMHAICELCAVARGSRCMK